MGGNSAPYMEGLNIGNLSQQDQRRRKMGEIEKKCNTCKHQHDEMLICTKNPTKCFPHAGSGYLLWEARFPEDSLAYAQLRPNQFVHDATDKPNDTINHPSHYTSHPSGIEAIQVTEHMNFCLGNAVKYLWRADEKHDDGGIEDLKKATWYIERELTRRQNDKHNG